MAFSITFSSWAVMCGNSDRNRAGSRRRLHDPPPGGRDVLKHDHFALDLSVLQLVIVALCSL
jgi:hypothetical protein